MMSRAPEVLCVGAVTLDAVVEIDTVPADDERVLSRASATGCGGPAATAAVTLARLGVDVGFAGVVGYDMAGKAVLESLESAGVSTAYVRRDRGTGTATSVILIETSSPGRRIITSRPPAFRLDVVPSGASWVHVDHLGHGAVQSLGCGVALSVDDGNLVDGLDLSTVDLYVPTTAVLRRRFPTHDVVGAVAAARTAGAGAVVATAGAGGCHVAVGDGEPVHVPAFRVPVRSTLGAGDVFHGGLLAATVRGLPLLEAARFASATAALSCRALDGQSGIPRLEEVEALMAGVPAPTFDLHTTSDHRGDA